MDIILAIDNGSTGTACIMRTGEIRSEEYFRMPVKNELDCMDSTARITRIDVDKLVSMLSTRILPQDRQRTRAYIERPFKNTINVNTTIASVRALEATLIALEDLGIGVDTPLVTPLAWQKDLFPAGYKPAKPKKVEIVVEMERLLAAEGKVLDKEDPEMKKYFERAKRNLSGPKVDTKKLSREIGTKLFPHLAEQIKKFKDADALLIAEWARRNR